MAEALAHDVSFLAQATFWLTCWFLAATAGAFRAVRDRDYGDWIRLVCSGCYGGLVSIAMVGYFFGGRPDLYSNWWKYLSVAILVGALGKEQDDFVREVIHRVFQAIGIASDQSTEEADSAVSED